MKHNFITLTLFFICLTSYSQSKELDQSNLNSISEFTINCIKNNDSTSFLKLFDFSINEDVEDKVAVKELLLSEFKEANFFFKNKNVEFFKYDNLDALAGGEVIDNTSFNIYTKVDGVYYKLRLTNHQISTNTFFSFYFQNYSKECDDFEKKTYRPLFSVFCPQLNWNKNNTTSFENVRIPVQNLSEYKVNEIKFRLTIENLQKHTIVMSETFTSKVQIEPGDLGTIYLNELNGFKPGFIILENNFNYKIELLEVSPKPTINPCAKIQSLLTK